MKSSKHLSTLCWKGDRLSQPEREKITDTGHLKKILIFLNRNRLIIIFVLKMIKMTYLEILGEISPIPDGMCLVFVWIMCMFHSLGTKRRTNILKVLFSSTPGLYYSNLLKLWCRLNHQSSSLLDYCLWLLSHTDKISRSQNIYNLWILSRNLTRDK